MLPLDMRGIARMLTCEYTRMLRTDCVFFLSRRVRSLRNRAAAARRRRNLPKAQKQPRMLPLQPLLCGGDGIQGPPAPAAPGWAVDARMNPLPCKLLCLRDRACNLNPLNPAPNPIE
jgi:hypothetical protein